MSKVAINFTHNPQWIEHDECMLFLEWVRANPTWWLGDIKWKYFECRVDSRTGDMLIKASEYASVPAEYLESFAIRT